MAGGLEKWKKDFLRIAAEYEKRAARTPDVDMWKALREIAEQYRRLAAQAADNPHGTR
jgi:hypothetical protein